MAERGLQLVHTSILRWSRFGASAGCWWRVDETYIKMRGECVYLYRAVDKAGHMVDFRLSSRQDVAAAKVFFKKAMRQEGQPPHTITLDGYAASHRAVREMRTDGLLSKRTKLRSSKYLNNLIEQDHRGIKSRTRPLAWLQEFRMRCHHDCWHRTTAPYPQGQFALGRLRLKGNAAPAIWNAVLAA